MIQSAVQWWDNPRIKSWVAALVESKDALGRAIKSPLKDMLGCGHWGCVFDSTGPWVVKLTIDPNEAPIWERILRLLDEEGYGQGGLVRVKGLYRLEPGVTYGGRSKRVYAVVREAVDPVFISVSGSKAELSASTKRKLGVAVAQRAFVGYVYPSFVMIGPRPSPRIDDFLTNINALAAYQSEARNRAKDRLERIVYRLGGPYGGALGETLLMLLSNNVILQDVHLGNIGWRKHRHIKGFSDQDTTMVIFDPGHTPAGRGVTVPSVQWRV